jgi:hypothetical protein
VTTEPRNQSTRCRGRCNCCGEGGHRARECCAPRDEVATAPAAQAASGAARQPETMPVDIPHTVIAADVEGEGLWTTEEAATHAQIDDVEPGLSRGIPYHPDPNIHAQTVSTEPETKPGKPATLEEGAHVQIISTEQALSGSRPNDLKEVAHTQIIRAESDTPRKSPGNLNTTARMHLAGTEPEPLLDAKEDEVEEDGAVEMNAVKGDMDPRVDLQGPRVSTLAMLEETTVIPESTGRADLAPPLLDTPPGEATDHPNHKSPKPIRAPAYMGESSELLRGEPTRRATCQSSWASARAPESQTPCGEAHPHPPDPPDPKSRSSIVVEQAIVVPKAKGRAHQAQRPVFDESAPVCPDPWPSPGIVETDPDVYTGSSVLLEGEQNFILPSVGCKQHTHPLSPQSTFIFTLEPHSVAA